nr:hypothetical protein [Allomuricauda sp.]
MTKRKLIQHNRKWHRYLGVLLGIQFFLWTLGGLYFSWTNIDEIRGDHLKKENALSLNQGELLSPTSILKQNQLTLNSVSKIDVTNIGDKVVYRFALKSPHGKSIKLFDAVHGQAIAPLSEPEAIKVAKNGLNVPAKVTAVEFLTTAGNHHEYRGRPLPAYAISFAQPANTTIYVSKDYGNIQTFRSNQWRAFDFFWMLHTMDYQGRDNFNNYLLRAFAIFGLITILSGFSLYIFTSRIFNKKRRK